jgi:hypothetical protein
MSTPNESDDKLCMHDVDLFREGGANGVRRRAEAHEGGRETAQPPTSGAELHVCQGLNACKGHGLDGSGRLAGMGACATVFHVCHGANDCRGQGGCGYSGFDAEQAVPGAQECRHSGSCASPINVSRVHAAGPFRGTSVWKRARKVFEQRMYEAGVPFGPAPGEGFPDDVVPRYVKPRCVEPRCVEPPVPGPHVPGPHVPGSPRPPADDT